MKQTGKYVRIEKTRHNRQDSADRTAQTGDNRQVRIIRTRDRLRKLKSYYRNMALPTTKGFSL